MSDESVLSRSTMVLGEALRPVSRAVKQRMGAAPSRTGLPDDLFGFVVRHVDRIKEHIEALDIEINGGINRAIAPGTDVTEVRRIATRMEVHIERILDNYDEVRRMRDGTRDADALSLLEGIYRKLLGMVQELLAEIFEFVDDPEAASRRRGLATEGRVEHTIVSELEVGRELEGLERWVKQQAVKPNSIRRDFVDGRRDECVDRGDRRKDGDLLKWVAVAFGLGLLFGGDDDG